MQGIPLISERNGPSCVWNLGWLVNWWKEPIISRDPQEWQGAVRRYWSKLYQPLHVPWWYKLWFHEWLLAREL